MSSPILPVQCLDRVPACSFMGWTGNTVSKSIPVNLKSLRKKGGTLTVLRREEDDMATDRHSIQRSLSEETTRSSVHVLRSTHRLALWRVSSCWDDVAAEVRRSWVSRIVQFAPSTVNVCSMCYSSECPFTCCLNGGPCALCPHGKFRLGTRRPGDLKQSFRALTLSSLHQHPHPHPHLST